MDKKSSLEILEKYVKSPNLVKHGIAVGSAMKHFALVYGEDLEYWESVGLLHDIDYELYPNQHCQKCVEILKSENLSDEMAHSIRSHGYGICSDIKPELKMEKVLYTIDELTGLIMATALMRPDKKLEEVELKSVKKKWKIKGFASRGR